MEGGENVSCPFQEAAVGLKLILYAIEQPGKSVKCILYLQNETKINGVVKCVMI